MSFALSFALLFGGVLTAVSFLMCGLFYCLERTWPIWHFRLFFAWWWPFRKASAASMLADTMVSSFHKDWKESAYKDFVNGKLGAKFTTFCDKISAEINGEKIPLSQWDKYRIATAITRFKRGDVGDARHDSARKAAEVILAAYGEKS